MLLLFLFRSDKRFLTVAAAVDDLTRLPDDIKRMPDFIQRSFAKLGALRQELLLVTAREVAAWWAYFSAPGQEMDNFWYVVD